MVPFAAGGPTDRVARDLAEALRKPLGGVQHRGRQRARRRQLDRRRQGGHGHRDGYTLLLNHIGMATMPDAGAQRALQGRDRLRIPGHRQRRADDADRQAPLQANNFKELSAWIAANKGKINLGNAGVGSASHLCGLLFQTALKTEMTPVPYKGTAPAITDLIGGQIDLLCDQTTNTSPQIEAKKVKAYAVTTPKRLTTPLLKDLPTLAGSGPEGLPGHHLARPVRAEGHAADIPRSSTTR